MNDISKVSDITYQDLIDYIRIQETDQSDINTLNSLLNVAKNYVKSYTGLTEELIDRYPEIVIVILILCQDMWDNRVLYVDTNNLNKTVESILGLHQVNLL